MPGCFWRGKPGFSCADEFSTHLTPQPFRVTAKTLEVGAHVDTGEQRFDGDVVDRVEQFGELAVNVHAGRDVQWVCRVRVDTFWQVGLHSPRLPKVMPKPA